MNHNQSRLLYYYVNSCWSLCCSDQRNIEGMEVPEHNSDPSKIILTAKAKDSPYVKQWYNSARKSFIKFLKLFNDNESQVIPAWVYEEEQKTELQKLRQLWAHFHSVWPTIGFQPAPDTDNGNGDIMAIMKKLEAIGVHLDRGLRSCEPWMTYSTHQKTLRVKVEDYCFDNM